MSLTCGCGCLELALLDSELLGLLVSGSVICWMSDFWFADFGGFMKILDFQLWDQDVCKEICHYILHIVDTYLQPTKNGYVYIIFAGPTAQRPNGVPDPRQRILSATSCQYTVICLVSVEYY